MHLTRCQEQKSRTLEEFVKGEARSEDDALRMIVTALEKSGEWSEEDKRDGSQLCSTEPL